jgi:hypothetical protein
LIGAIIFVKFYANPRTQSATGNSQSSHGEDDIPKFWTFPNSDATVNVEINGDYLNLHSVRWIGHGLTIGENCALKSNGYQWAGKCHEQLWTPQSGQTPECSYDLDEVITSVSSLHIDGQFQVALPSQEGEICPSPKQSMHEFEMVPKPSETQSGSNVAPDVAQPVNGPAPSDSEAQDATQATSSDAQKAPSHLQGSIDCSSIAGSGRTSLLLYSRQREATGEEVECGSAVEILGRDDLLSRIRTADGVEGWLQSSYIK